VSGQLDTEWSRTYVSLELAAAARKLLAEVALVRAGEAVAITADTRSDLRVVEAAAQEAYALDAHPVVVRYETRERIVFR
jgi:hypothetical protein